MLGRPPKKKTLSPAQARAAEAFVSGADARPEASASLEDPAQPVVSSDATPRARRGKSHVEASRRPWEAPHVREDVVKGYALRLPEPLYLQLKWVAEQTGRSVNAVCREAIEREIGPHLPD